MKFLVLFALLATACHLSAADKPSAPADPFAGAFFPPEIVYLTGDQIGLTPSQREAFRTRLDQTQTRASELTEQLGRETSALSALATPARLQEAALIAQLDRVLDAERELKHLQMGLLVWIKNFLTPEQQTKLRELTKGGAADLIEATRIRLTAKVERVQQGVQKWTASGRDPSAIIKTMDEKVKPLLDAVKPVEAEIELDRVLFQLETEEN